MYIKAVCEKTFMLSETKVEPGRPMNLNFLQILGMWTLESGPWIDIRLTTYVSLVTTGELQRSLINKSWPLFELGAQEVTWSPNFENPPSTFWDTKGMDVLNEIVLIFAFVSKYPVAYSSPLKGWETLPLYHTFFALHVVSFHASHMQ